MTVTAHYLHNLYIRHKNTYMMFTSLQYVHHDFHRCNYACCVTAFYHRLITLKVYFHTPHDIKVTTSLFMCVLSLSCALCTLCKSLSLWLSLSLSISISLSPSLSLSLSLSHSLSLTHSLSLSLLISLILSLSLWVCLSFSLSLSLSVSPSISLACRRFSLQLVPGRDVLDWIRSVSDESRK